MTHVANLGLERKRWRMQGRRHAARVARVPFPELVHAHALWRDALEGRREQLSEHDRHYHEVRRDFERGRGEIVNRARHTRGSRVKCTLKLAGEFR